MKVEIACGKTILVGMAFAAFLGGCASPTSEDDFGNSVRRMIEAQKYTPPDQKVPPLPTLDGQKAEASVEQYRNEAGNPARIYQDMSYGATPVSQ